MFTMRVALVCSLLAFATALCPFMSRDKPDEAPYQWTSQSPSAVTGHTDALMKLDFDAVKRDIKKMFTESQAFWPADYNNYGPLFVRLAWHNSGSYRTSDGRGGADGGRQRFDPERSWEDNTNLDKARTLLWPIKEKYGKGLSWGDLIILTGNTAIESMGGPVLGFCAGRVDDSDGFWSQELGPTDIQEQVAPCAVNGQCKPPLGSTTVGLIYLNPEGPMSNPDPVGSARDVRDSFGRMAMNDSETVALIGGGHAFGKTHGACPKGHGPSPKEDPANPWPGLCGTGKGADAFTSGFEGPWTTRPTWWDNEYFHNLLNYQWESFKGPGGKFMWRVVNGTNPVAPGPQGGKQNTMMMTSDVSLLHDEKGEYQKIVKEFANDPAKFDDAFSHAWYKLTTRDMGPITRCLGSDVPPAQDWQNPLPAPPAHLADFTAVRKAVSAVITNDPDYAEGALLVRLAWQCSSTFRVTDYLGGCNGARVRQSPQKDWPQNVALNMALDLLQPIYDKFDGLSWADLIVVAGTEALEHAGGPHMCFCGGRTDASAGTVSDGYLKPTLDGSVNNTILQLKQAALVMGLTPREMTVLNGGGHSLGMMHQGRSGYTGAWTSNPTKLSNSFFSTLLSETWEPYTVPHTGMQQYKAAGKELYMLETDMMFKWDAEFLAISQDYAGDNQLFLKEFSAAWTKMMNADRFMGPSKNLCDKTCEPQVEAL